MIKYTLDTPIAKLPRINERYLKRFHKLGLNTVRDLLYHFPNRYDDFSKIVTIDKLKLNETATIQGEVLKIDNIRTFKKGMSLTEALVKDPTGSVRVIWFNQPFLIKNLAEGKKVSLSGKYAMGPKGPYLSNPSYETIMPGKTATHTAGLVPIYPETTGLGSRFLRYYIKLILPAITLIKEPLPYETLKEYNLPSIQIALKNIHFPTKLKLADEARKRFAFEELFLLQLYVLKQKINLRKENAFKIAFDKNLIQTFVKKLPFELTKAQKKAIWEIIQDLEKSEPMNRLLQGDVGSGKTVVATAVALEVAKTGYQVAFMAPTEILAQQHFKEIQKLLNGFDVEIGLLTGSEKISSEKTKIFVGTHALIQKSVHFKNLALVIVDEQHRFGVSQRAALARGSTQINTQINADKLPHLLSMTATPIPRTLALTIYGDLDISLLNEMPKNRQKIITKIVPPNEREQAYEFIRQEVKKGRQCFVICPRIELSKDENIKNLLWAEVKAVKEEYEKLSEKIFPDLEIDMIHGKIPATRKRGRGLASAGGGKSKEEIMSDFRNKKTDVLVSTSVIEVGIDIPNATVMMIEGADRFGLAQLHQFRGRVGRGEHQSYCLLLSTSGNTTTRLRALVKCDNGFELAEKDLEIRGPGQFYGVQQSGLPDLAMASLNDLELIKSTRVTALELLKKDLNLRSYPLLLEKLNKFKQTIHLE
jgi:ATP-dependent DNA helicase RecG